MKTLKNITEAIKGGFQGPKHNQGIRQPNETGPAKKFIGNTPVSKTGNAVAPSEGTQEFVNDHEIEVIADRNGNGDEVFKGSVVKTVDRKKEKHGYNAKESEDVNERRLTMKELSKREEVAKAIERENPGIDMSKKMAIATATAKKVAEALDPHAKAKENVEFHHGQATDYAKEIGSMLGDYKKHLKGEKHVGEYHAVDIAQIHGGLKQVHDALKYAVMGIKPVKTSVAIAEEVEQQDQDADIVEAYAVVLESVYESLEEEADKEAFLEMLESDDAFDELMDLVQETLGAE